MWILTWASMQPNRFWMEATRWFLMAKDGGSNFLDGFTRRFREHELVDSMRQELRYKQERMQILANMEQQFNNI